MIVLNLIRIATGEEIVAEIVSEEGNTITVNNALVVIPQAGNVGFTPWSPVIDPENTKITVSRNHIVYIAKVDPSVQKRYNEIFGSRIVTPEDKKLIL